MTQSNHENHLTVPKYQILPDGAIERLLSNAQTLIQSLKNPYPVEAHIDDCAFEVGLATNDSSFFGLTDRTVLGVETSLVFVAATATLQQETIWLPRWLLLLRKLEPFMDDRFSRVNSANTMSALKSWLSLLPKISSEIFTHLQSIKSDVFRALAAKYLRADDPEDYPLLLEMLRDRSIRVRFAAHSAFEKANLTQPWMVLLPTPPPNASDHLNAQLTALLNQLPRESHDHGSKINFADTLAALDALPIPTRVDIILNILDDFSWFLEKKRCKPLLQRLVDAGDLGATRLCQSILRWMSLPRKEYVRADPILEQLTAAPESWRTLFCRSLAAAFSTWDMLTITHRHQSLYLNSCCKLFCDLWPTTLPIDPLLDIIDALPHGYNGHSTIYSLTETIQKSKTIPWHRIEQQAFAEHHNWTAHDLFEFAKKCAPAPVFNQFLARAQQSPDEDFQRAAVQHGPLSTLPPDTPESLSQLQDALLDPKTRSVLLTSYSTLAPLLPMVRTLLAEDSISFNFDELAGIFFYMNLMNLEQCHNMQMLIIKLSQHAHPRIRSRNTQADSPKAKLPWWKPKPNPKTNPATTIQPHEWALYRTLRAQVTDRNAHFWSRVLHNIPIVDPDPSDIACVEEARTLWLNKDPAIKTHDLIPVLLGLHGPKSLAPLLDQVWAHALTPDPDPDSDFDQNRDLIQLGLALAPNRFLPPHLKSHSRDSIPEWMDTSD
jgi:hypothetical protein